MVSQPNRRRDTPDNPGTVGGAGVERAKQERPGVVRREWAWITVVETATEATRCEGTFETLL